MQGTYKKDCYDQNPHVKVHYSHGIREVGATLPFLHYDKDLIIEYYRKGEASIRIEGNLYDIKEGDVVILNPDEMHVSERKDNCYMEKIVLHINDGLLGQFFADRSIFFEKISKKTKGKGNLIAAEVVKNFEIDKRIDSCLNLAKAYSEENNVLLCCKTIELLSIFTGIIQNTEEINVNTASSNNIVNKIIDYISRHYTEELSLDIIANRFHFSKYYISHLFKEYVGISPIDYLTVRRLYVVNNLIRSGASVKEASTMVGFSNYSNFFRLYKKYFKITPAHFKEQLKSEVK